MRTDAVPHGWPTRSAPPDAAGLFALYFGLGWASLLIAAQPGSIAAIWLANGVATAFILTAPPAAAPALLAAAVLADALAGATAGHGAAASLGSALANGVEIALAVYLVRRTGRATRFANDHASLLWVLAAGAWLPPLIGATLAAFVPRGVVDGGYGSVWSDWVIGAVLGGSAVLPLALSLRSTPVADWWPRLFGGWAAASGPAVFAVTVLLLHYLSYSFVAIGIALALLALVLPRVCTLFNTLVMVCAFTAALPMGWFVPSAPDSPLGHFLVFIAVTMVVVPTQIVAVVVARQRALSEMLAAVGSRANDIIVVTDVQGVFRWANAARAVYWGTPDEQALGRTWADNVPAAVYRDIMEPMLAKATTGATARTTAEIDFPSLGRRAMDILVQPARDEEGRYIGVLSCSTDVTEIEASRRELQQLADQLQQSNRSLEQFVHIASHDLREPLNTIAQFCQLIERDTTTLASDTVRMYFAQIQAGAIRMKAMLDDLLRFVRLEHGAELGQEDVSLDTIVAEALASLRSSIDAAGASIDVAPLGPARGYRGLLLLVMQNLISNAIKFVPPQRRATVGIQAVREGDLLRLTVADNGIGIEATRIEELGTPFRRLHSRRKFEGTGLGLAICKRIAEQHGGRLEIESVHGEGSRFHLLIAQG